MPSSMEAPSVEDRVSAVASKLSVALSATFVRLAVGESTLKSATTRAWAKRDSNLVRVVVEFEGATGASRGRGSGTVRVRV